jgi:hypothetical protein
VITAEPGVEPRGVVRFLRSRGVFIGCALALVLLATVPELSGRTIPDTGWLLYAAGEMLDGARLYVDLIEVNPPLIVWLNAIPVTLARITSLSPILVYRLLVLVVVLASMMVSAGLIARGMPGERVELRRFFVLLLLFGVLTLARGDFGEREHLLLALGTPYVLLSWLRSESVPVSRTEAITIGVAAGVGIALKPYFVLVWLALQAYLWAVLRPRRFVPGAESVAVLGVGVAYLVAVVLWAPEYWQIVGLMAGPYYAFLSNSLVATAILGDGAAIPLVAGLAFVALRHLSRHPRLWSVLMLATAALYGSAVFQHKGWRYHFYPSMAFGIVLLGLMAVDSRRPAISLAERVFSILAAPIALGIALWTSVACLVQSLSPLASRYDSDPDVGQLIPLVREHAAGGSVMVLSWSIASTYPLVNYSGVRSASRFNSMWILGAVYRDQTRGAAPIEYRERARMSPLEAYFGDAVVEDLSRDRPRLIVALRPAPDRPEWHLRRLNFVAYFLRDPRFERLFSRYRSLGETGEYWLFERLPENAAPVRHEQQAYQPPA